MKIFKRILITLNVLAFLILVYVFVVTVVIPVSKAYLPLTKLERPVEKPTKKSKKAAEKSSSKSTKGAQKEVKEEEVPVEENVSDKELIARFETLSNLRKQAAFLSARYDLSKQDSIYLVIDLIDSVAMLEVKGISVHRAKIHAVEKSHSLKLFHDKDFSLWLEYPFELKAAKATIPKIPIVIKQAPKDTIEAAAQVVIPTAPKREDVYITMDFTKNLRLNISQVDKLDSIGEIRIDSLAREHRKRSFVKAYESLHTYKYDKIAPFINIKLNKADATIIYRALPDRPQMVLRM